MVFEKPAALKEVLEGGIKMREEDVVNYMKHAVMAEELGLTDIRFHLEEIAADKASYARELRRILKGLQKDIFSSCCSFTERSFGALMN